MNDRKQKCNQPKSIDKLMLGPYEAGLGKGDKASVTADFIRRLLYLQEVRGGTPE